MGTQHFINEYNSHGSTTSRVSFSFVTGTGFGTATHD